MAIDQEKLIEALNESDPGTQWFADIKLQTVRKVSLKDPQSIEKFKRDLAADARRFVKIPKRSSEERYAELQGFIKIVADKALASKLTDALSSPAPFREFRLLLERKAKEKRQLDAYLKSCSQKRLNNFLKTTHLG
ncbi:MAG: UPF0158 family protein [Candidatus Bruticola sp.]